MGDIGIQASAAAEKYSIPHETQKLFREGIIKNPLISKFLRREANGFANKVKFVGSDAPSIPINWRFAESVASLKGLEARAINVLLAKKYGVKPQEVVISTRMLRGPANFLLTFRSDHAQLFIMSTLLWSIDLNGEKITGSLNPEAEKYFPSCDIHRQAATHHRNSCINIYKTKDGRFFHLHESMNTNPSLNAIGLPRK